MQIEENRILHSTSTRSTALQLLLQYLFTLFFFILQRKRREVYLSFDFIGNKHIQLKQQQQQQERKQETRKKENERKNSQLVLIGTATKSKKNLQQQQRQNKTKKRISDHYLLVHLFKTVAFHNAHQICPLLSQFPKLYLREICTYLQNTVLTNKQLVISKTQNV